MRVSINKPGSSRLNSLDDVKVMMKRCLSPPPPTPSGEVGKGEGGDDMGRRDQADERTIKRHPAASCGLSPLQIKTVSLNERKEVMITN